MRPFGVDYFFVGMFQKIKSRFYSAHAITKDTTAHLFV